MTQKVYYPYFHCSPAASFHHGAYFGEGSGPIFVDDLKCSENSTHINNCSYITYDNCFHSNDVSVVCTGKEINNTVPIIKVKKLVIILFITNI